MALNDELFDALTRHQIALGRLTRGTSAKLVQSLDKFDPAIARALASLNSSSTRRQVNEALAEVKRINNAAYDKIEKQLTTQMERLAVSEVKYQHGALKDATPREAFKQMNVKVPPAAATKALVRTEAVNGALLSEHVDGMRVGRYNRVRDAVRREMSQGGTEAAVEKGIRQAVIGTAAAGYQDGLLGLSRRSMDQVTKTVSNGTVTNARSTFFEQNDDIFDGVMWVSVLDDRTSAICQSLDGTVFPVDEGPRPPAHINCRSEVVPIVKDWEEMGLEDLGPGTREAMNGEVPETMTYDDWLRTQSAEVQNEILGPSRGEIFREGEVTLDKFVDNSGRLYSLDDLEKQGVLK